MDHPLQSAKTSGWRKKNFQRDPSIDFPNGCREPDLGVLRAFTANSACSAMRFPNEPSPAGCGAHPEILNPPSVGGPFFVIIAKPSLPWTSSQFPPLPLTYSTASLSSATTVGASSTSMLPGTPPAVGSFSSYERPSLISPLPDFSSLITTRSCGLQVPAAIRSMDMACVRTSLQSPWQNGVAERWVGSCRRDVLDHVIALNEHHLKRLLSEYIRYYHDDRTHLGLNKETPGGRVRSAAWGPVVSYARLGGLHHRYNRAA